MTSPFLGTQTILLVESRNGLRKHIKDVLEAAHFNVIAANNVKHATRLVSEFPGTIHLLLTNLTVAGVSGPNLAKKLQERRPQMCVLIMSGFPGGSLLLLNGGWYYVEKTAVPAFLANKIRELTGRSSEEGSADRLSNPKVPRRPPARPRMRFEPPSGHTRRSA